MYKENRSFLVVSYFIFQNTLYWIEHTTSGNTRVYRDAENSLEIKGQIRPTYFVFNGSQIILSDSNKKVAYVVDGNKVDTLPGHVVAALQDFLLLVNKDDNAQVLLLNTTFETIEKHAIKIGARRFSNDHYFIAAEYLNNSVLKIIELPSFASISIPVDADSWSSSEGSTIKGEVCQTIGIWNNQLILHLAKFVIVALDIKTGKRLWQIDNFFESIDADKYISFDESSSGRTPMEWHLDTSKGFAYLLVRHFFLQLDLHHQTCVPGKSYLSDEPEHRWNFTRTRLVEGGEIFFAGSKGFSSTSNYIGCFDVKEQAVHWENKADDGSYYAEAPREYEDGLCVLDNKNFLHVFESNK
jgi:hypothetical protein